MKHFVEIDKIFSIDENTQNKINLEMNQIQ